MKTITALFFLMVLVGCNGSKSGSGSGNSTAGAVQGSKQVAPPPPKVVAEFSDFVAGTDNPENLQEAIDKAEEEEILIISAE